MSFDGGYPDSASPIFQFFQNIFSFVLFLDRELILRAFSFFICTEHHKNEKLF